MAIVNESFVKHYFPNENALGQRMRPWPPGRIWDNQKLTSFEIVGIVRDVKLAGLEAPSEPAYYLPASQAPLEDMTLLVRTTTDPLSIVGAVRQAVWSIDPNQPISNVSTLEKVVDDSIAQRRFNMLLMGLFGGAGDVAVGGWDLRFVVACGDAAHAGDGNSHGARRAGE